LFRRYTFAAFLVFVFVVLFLSSTGSTLYTELLWFQTLGYLSVFLTAIYSRWVLVVAVGLAFAVLLYIGLTLARRYTWQINYAALEFPLDQLLTPRRVSLAFAGVSLVIGGLAGWAAGGRWLLVQSFLHRTPFGVADPVFGRDIGFYVFSLPFFSYAYQLAMLLLVIVLLAAVGLFLLTGSVSAMQGQFSFDQKSKRFLAAVAALLLAGKAVGYWLGIYRLVYSQRGVAFGASYTDVHASLPMLKVMIVLSLVGAVLVLLAGFRRGLRLAYAGVGLVIAGSLILGVAYPALVQQFSVSPNEMTKERRFIEYNIAATRQAFGLNSVEEKAFAAAEDLQPADLQEAADTIDNVRVWDWRPLLQTYAQLQEIRLYYNFQDVDVDRYEIDGRLRQMLLSARELDQAQLPDQAQTWISKHLKYTHGYGMVASPANAFTAGGFPELWVQNIPPRTEVDELRVERPEIYYGEVGTDYVIVKTTEPEFDYPSGDTNEYTTYDGTGGVSIGGLSRRLAFSLRFSSYRIMATGAITPESRIMYRRNIRDRVAAIAPFLTYDSDPYVVVADGRLYWMVDAYTTTNTYPFSEPFRNRFNYMRNSVKVVVDAYNGDVTFYKVDPTDPLLQTYAGIFPDLFQPFSAMPDGLKGHIRYPELLFNVQADMYANYHMSDPVVFYQKEDYWNRPTEKYGDEQRPVEPYYIIMQLPGEDEPEFILILPFTPRGKQNMIAWMAARCDKDNYGELLLFKFPKQRVVYGPMQIESLIDQDTYISQQLTLWGQRGSQVVRGSLLVVPVADSILYVEPLYLVATETQLPELKKVILGYAGDVVMADNLRAGLERLFGEGGAPPQAEEPPQPPAPGTDSSLANLIDQAAAAYEESVERAQAGDWAGYGEALNRLGDILEQLGRLEGEGQ